MSVRRFHALAARIDTVLLAMNDDEEAGAGERIGGISGAIGGAAAGAILPTIAKRTHGAAAAEALKSVRNPKAASGAAYGFPEAFAKLKAMPAVANSGIASGAVEGLRKASYSTARTAVKAGNDFNGMLAKGGRNTRLIGGAVLGLGGYLAGKGIGRIADNMGYTHDDDKK